MSYLFQELVYSAYQRNQKKTNKQGIITLDNIFSKYLIFILDKTFGYLAIPCLFVFFWFLWHAEYTNP